MLFKHHPQAPARIHGRDASGELLLWSRRKTRGRDQCAPMTDLAGYIERTLGGPDREQVEAHVAQCDACRHELVELYQLLKTPLEIPPHWFAGRIAEGLVQYL